MDNSSNNHLEPVIYIAESPEQAINYKWDSRANGLDRNIKVLEPSQIQKLSEGKEYFNLPYDLTPGKILIRHPYNQGYILATDAENDYLTASVDGILLTAQLLGATKITYKKHELNEYKREIDNKNKLKYKVVETNSEIKNKEEKKLLKKHFITRTFEKQEYTLEQFNKAKSIAEERGFTTSSRIRSLIDARNPEFGTLLSREIINVEISSSLNKVMDIAFSLTVTPIFNLDSNTKIACETKKELSIEWDIEF